jgi:hydroxymethylglutaryl-CoA reductase
MDRAGVGKAPGKVILLGEHAVVYRQPALVAALTSGVRAEVISCPGREVRLISLLQNGTRIANKAGTRPQKALHSILKRQSIPTDGYEIRLVSGLPISAGLGSSAALAVAIVRALDDYFHLDLSDEKMCELAFLSECVFHGSPSGIDNTCATYGGAFLFRPPHIEERITPPRGLRIVIGNTRRSMSTKEMVRAVRVRRDRHPEIYERIFEAMGDLARRGAVALKAGDMEALGDFMNLNQGYLNAIGVSSREIEDLVAIAREAGAKGAKLTGAGGGGCVVAIAPEREERVRDAMAKAGYEAWISGLGGDGESVEVPDSTSEGRARRKKSRNR